MAWLLKPLPSANVCCPSRNDKERRGSPGGWLNCSWPKGWQVQKAAPKMDIEIPDNTLLSMLFIKGRTTVRQRNLDAALGYSASYGDWDGKKRQARHLGKRIAKALRVHQELEETKMRYESANKYFASLVREALELEPDESYWPLWKVGDLVREIQRKAMERGDPIEHH